MARTRPLQPMDSPDAVEQEFYDALQQADIDRLMAVWADEEEIACIHPAGARLVGTADIRSSFETLFANGPIDATPERVQRLQAGNCAIHSVLECVQAMLPEGRQTAWVAATNVYVKTGMGWRLAVHHASPGTAREVQALLDGPATLH